MNHQRHRVLQPEVLEPRVLLAGDVLPNWDNNLGFDRNAIDNWGFEFVNGDPSVGSKIDYVAAGGQLHHEAVNLSVGPGDPAEGAFGYATVGRVAHAPSVSEVSSTTIWRTITLYPGETLEWAAAMIIGKDSPNFGNNGGRLDQGILSYGNYFNYSFPVGDTNGAGWTSGWQKFSYQNNTGQTIVDNIKAKAVKPYRTNNLNGSGNPRWTYRVSVAIDQVIIRDNDDAGPTISSNTGGGSDGDNNYFSWNVSDPSGVSRVDVRVYNQSTGSLVKQWLGAPAVSSIDMNDVGVGTFKMLVEAWDNDNNRPNDISYSSQWLENYTIADDDTGAPGISDANVLDQNDGQDNYVEWFVGDVSGVSRAIVQLQEEVGAAGSNQWNTFYYSDDTNPTASKGGHIDLNAKSPGRYRFRVQAWDSDTDWSGDQLSSDTGWKVFTISDDDTSVPTAVLSGSSGTESWGLRNAFSWSASDPSGIAATSVTVTRNGQVVYSDSQAAAQGEIVLDPWGLGTYVIKVSPTDNDVDRPGDQLTLSPPAERTVVVTNSPPTAVGDTATIDEDSLLVVTQPKLVANDVDADPGDPLTVAAVNGSDANVGKTIRLASGASLTVNADGSYTYDPRGYFNVLRVGGSLSDSFTYTVRDAWNQRSDATVVVTVTGVNDVPFPRDDTYSVDEDNSLSISAPGVLGNDFDADLDTLTVAVDTQPLHGTLQLNADGSFVYTPTPNFQGTDSFKYVAKDAYATSPPATVTINVNSVNDAPVLAPIGDQAIDEENALSFTVTGSDPNDDPANNVTLSVTGLP
ncbi:MAG: tandem-95 repeat protein, partial [Candidatus Zixiibacteriota bacterium]